MLKVHFMKLCTFSNFYVRWYFFPANFKFENQFNIDKDETYMKMERKFFRKKGE